MDIIQIVILALSSNMDDMAFGFALGLKEKVLWWVAVIIGGMSGLTMCIGMLAGEQIVGFIPDQMERWISAGIYLVLAIWFAWDEYNSTDDARAEDAPRRWTIGKAFGMGAALGVDSLGLGISAGITGYPVVLTSILAGTTSIGLILIGGAFAERLAQGILKEKAGYLSAGLLVVLAIMTLFG